MYFSSWLAIVKDCSHSIEKRSISWADDATTFDTSFLTTLKTAVQIVWFPVKSFLGLAAASKNTTNKHGKNIEAFYQDQASAYDSFRENFLHARGPMLTCIPTNKEGSGVWVDVGGGTARNLEFIPVDVIKHKFKKIYVVDISPSLLEVAKARVETQGLSDIVECVCCDFTDEKSVKKALPKFGTIDVVTFSYSLSMIPDKAKALDSACKLLKSAGKGTLAVADFFEYSSREHLLQYPIQWLRWLESRAHKHWFKCDGVNLLTDKVFEDMIEGNGKLPGPMEKQFEEKFRGSVPLFPILRPYQGFCLFQKK